MTGPLSLNPFLSLKKTSKTKNVITLTLNDIRCCKKRIVSLKGFNYFKKQKDLIFFLKQFNGKSTLSAILKKIKLYPSFDLSQQDFLNLILYFINEDILVGIN